MIREFISEVTMQRKGNNIEVDDLLPSFVVWYKKKYNEEYKSICGLFFGIPKDIMRNGYIMNVDLVYPYNLCLLNNNELIDVFLLNQTTHSTKSKILVCVLFERFIKWVDENIGNKTSGYPDQLYDSMMNRFTNVLKTEGRLDDKGTYVLCIQFSPNPKKSIDMGTNKKTYTYKSDLFNFVNEMVVENDEIIDEIEIKELYCSYIRWCKENFHKYDCSCRIVFENEVKKMLRDSIIVRDGKSYYKKYTKI